jgi:SulP family sulfate permease
VKPKILTTLATYDAPQLRSDALAGITVALVALPLSIAIAIASGVPPAAGIVTAIVGGFLISALGGSKVQIGGPTGAFIVLVYGIVAKHGADGLVLATGMAGVILLIAAVLRAGRLIAMVPEPVIDGFTIGIAIVIATSQLRDFLGLHTSALPADFAKKIPVLWQARHSFDANSAMVGLVTLIAIASFRKRWPTLPGPLIVLALISAAALLWLPAIGTVGGSYGALPGGIGWPSLPQANPAMMLALLPAAFAIAFLAGIESLLSAVVADRMIGSQHRHGAELLAQGAANIGSALFGGIPATGAIARTATNVSAGGKTPVAGIIHALTIWALVALAGGLAGHLILPGLAALLLLTAWNMSEPKRWGERLEQPKEDLALLVLTALMTVLVDLTAAILVGTGIGLGLRYWRGRQGR